MESRLKELREEIGLSQKEVAERFGISQQTLSRYEMDANTISIDMLKSLSGFYRATIDYVLCVPYARRQFASEEDLEQEQVLVEGIRHLDSDAKNLLEHLIPYMERKNLP